MIKKISLKHSSTLQEDSLARLLEMQGFEVTTTQSKQEAVVYSLRNSPCVLMLDELCFQRVGYKSLNRIADLRASIKLVVIVSNADEGLIEKLFKTKADGIALESSGLEGLIRCLTQVASGKNYVDERLMSAKGRVSTALLSERETLIYQLVEEKMTSSEIASYLLISKRTVETVRLNIRRKLKIINGKWLQKL
jgi:DNA-binding NarL/FixJ family response regulator